MFTLEQIKTAHSKVRSGADFPAYIKELKSLGVLSYQTFVHDGHTIYKGGSGFEAQTSAKYGELIINKNSNSKQFKTDLKAHQQGKTDYPTFCEDCARSGVHKWEVSLERMTCTYFEELGHTLLVEEIPG